jgi:hypothetical protein
MKFIDIDDHGEFGNSKGVEKSIATMARGLVPLARVALVDVLANLVIHVWPIEVASDDFHGFACTPVPCYFGVMLGLEYRISEGSGNHQAMLEV